MARRFGKTEIIFTATILVLLLLERFNATNATFALWNQRFYISWTVSAVRFGYLGAFILAFIGNVTFVFVFPYTIAIFFLATSGLNPLILGVATGFGSVLGEFSGYILGRWGSRVFERVRPGVADKIRALLERRPRTVPLLLFCVTLLPVPADIMFIPLGMLRYKPWDLLWPATLGKIGAGLAIAYAGHFFFRLGTRVDPTTSLRLEFGTLILLTVILYVFFKLPWPRILERTIAGQSVRLSSAVDRNASK